MYRGLSREPTFGSTLGEFDRRENIHAALFIAATNRDAFLQDGAFPMQRFQLACRTCSFVERFGNEVAIIPASRFIG